MTDLRLNHPAHADDPEVPDVPVPPGPEPREPDENKAFGTPVNELESRLLRQRKVLVFGAIDDKVARDVTGRLLALAADAAPIRIAALDMATWRVDVDVDPRHDPLRGSKHRGHARVGDGAVRLTLTVKRPSANFTASCLVRRPHIRSLCPGLSHSAVLKIASTVRSGLT
jgi:hypothetical protein